MKDEKKKLLVLAALAVAVIAVGAFQFTGGSEAPPPPKAESEEKQAAQEDKREGQLVASKEPSNPLFAQPLPPRDPFQARQLPGAVATTPTPTPPQPKPEPVRQRPIRRPDFGAPPSGFAPFDPGGSLPRADGGGGGELKIEPEQFGYALSGIVLGDSPAAVFTDGTGAQRLVTAGSSLDGDSKVVGIARGKVTVRWKKKTMTLTVGGTADAK